MTALTPARVVEAFIDIAGEGGVPAASVRALAEHLGVSIGAVQHHYRHREALLLDSFEETARRIAARVGPGSAAPESIGEFVRLTYELLPLDVSRRGECRVYVELTSGVSSSDALRRARDRSRAEVRRVIALAITRLASGPVSSRSVREAAEAVALTLDGAMLRSLDIDGDQSTVLADVGASIRIILAGIGIHKPLTDATLG